MESMTFAEEFDADGPRLRRRPHVEQSAAERTRSPSAGPRPRTGSRLVAVVPRAARVDFLHERQRLAETFEERSLRDILEQGLNAGEQDGRPFGAQAALERLQAVADDVGMRRGAVAGDRFAAGKKEMVSSVPRRALRRPEEQIERFRLSTTHTTGVLSL